MRKTLKISLLAASLLFNISSQASNNCFKEVAAGNVPSATLMPFQPTAYKVFRADNNSLKATLHHTGNTPDEAILISLPMPDGTFRDFKVWEESMMAPSLAAKYPEIKTYSAVAVNDARVTAKLDFTLFGFHAIIFDGENTCFVDPYDRYASGYYFAHYRKDEVKNPSERMRCEFKGKNDEEVNGTAIELGGPTLPRLAQRTGNGWNLRTYDLALSANHQYCQAATGLSSPTIAQCLSAMTTTINRVNGLYERDFSVHMNFCAQEDTLIWNVSTGGPNGSDPFGSINSNASACLSANQTTCDARIGRANYDIGHVFTTGAGGLSSLGVVCNNSAKAQSVTGGPSPVGDGFDLDYVAHEMGHEFGSDHTFNNNSDGSCGGNAVRSVAYEPGSGATIMDYAGICPMTSSYIAIITSASPVCNKYKRSWQGLKMPVLPPPVLATNW
ncbi:MAG: hypothetical protein EBZ77_06805 [Chitinophagia bacterium]|nr:hypothetical protein [Chitinophagia bacterium]